MEQAEITKMFERHKYLHNNFQTLSSDEKLEFEMIDDYIQSKIWDYPTAEELYGTEEEGE